MVFINCKLVDTRWQWSFHILHMQQIEIIPVARRSRCPYEVRFVFEGTVPPMNGDFRITLYTTKNTNREANNYTILSRTAVISCTMSLSRG
jgi:hypothetical protein